MALRIYVNGVEEIPGDNLGIILSSIGSITSFTLRCDVGEMNAVSVTVNAPIDCLVSKDGVTYASSVVYLAGELSNTPVNCWVKRVTRTVPDGFWTGLVLTPRRAQVTTSVSVDTTPPAIGVLTATGGAGSLSLSWTAATDANGIALYEYSYSTSPTYAGATVGTTTNLSAALSNIPAGAYNIRLRAKDPAGNWSSYATATATVSSSTDNVSPTIAGSLVATPGDTFIVVGGPTASDNVGIAKWQYTKDAGANWTDVLSTATTFPSTMVTGLTNGVSATIGVRAVDAAGNFSSTVSASATPYGIIVAGLVADFRASKTNTAHTGPHLNSDTDVLTWHDLSGNARDLTGHEFPTPPTTSNGWSTAIPYAYVCPGPSSGGSFGNANVTPFNLTGVLTIELWIKPQRSGTGGAARNLVTAYGNSGSTYDYSLEIEEDVNGGIRFNMGNSPTGWQQWRSSQGPLTGAWSHVILIVDASNIPYLWVNGVLKSWNVVNPTFSGSRQAVTIAGGYAIHIGSGSTSASSFPGSMAQARIYSAAFGSSDVTNNFGATRAEFGV